MHSSDYCKYVFIIILSLSLNSNAQLMDVAKSLAYIKFGNDVNVWDKIAGKHATFKEFELKSPVAQQITSLGLKNILNSVIRTTLANPDQGLSKLLHQYFISDISWLTLPGAEPQTYISPTLKHALDFLKEVEKTVDSNDIKDSIARIEELSKKVASYNTKDFATIFKAIDTEELLDLVDNPKTKALIQSSVKELKKIEDYCGNLGLARVTAFSAFLRFYSIIEHAKRYDNFIYAWKKAHAKPINGTIPIIEKNDYSAWEQLVITKEIIEEDPQTAFVAFAHSILSHSLVLITQIFGDTFVRKTLPSHLGTATILGRFISTAFGMIASYGYEHAAKDKLRAVFNEFEMYDPHYNEVYDSAYIVGVKAPFAWTAWRGIYDYATIFAIQLLVGTTLMNAYENVSPVKEALLGWLTLSLFVIAYNFIPLSDSLFNNWLWKGTFFLADIAKDGVVLSYQTIHGAYAEEKIQCIEGDSFNDCYVDQPKEEL